MTNTVFELKANIDNLLIRTDIELTQHQENANRYGEQFNIFNILKMERKEVETHSRFIFELLNKNGSHGMGSTFLELFITEVLSLELESCSYTVKREDGTEEGRRIDFTLESKNKIIGIEMKIDAADQNKQLYDYYHALKQRASHKDIELYYLTLFGHEASTDSLYGLPDDKYQQISFEDHVSQWLIACIKEAAMKPVLRDALLQYKMLIDKLTGQHQEFTMDLASKLVSSPNDLSAAFAIEKAVTESQIMIQKRFWDALNQRLIEEGKTVQINGGKSIQSMSRNYYKNNRSNKNIGLNYSIGEYNSSDVRMYINLYSWVHYGLRICNQDNKPIKSKVTGAKLSPLLNNGNAVANKHDDWIVCYYNDESTEQPIVKFSEFDKQHTIDPVLLSLTDDLQLKDIIESMVCHLSKIEIAFTQIKQPSTL